MNKQQYQGSSTANYILFFYGSSTQMFDLDITFDF